MGTAERIFIEFYIGTLKRTDQRIPVLANICQGQRALHMKTCVNFWAHPENNSLLLTFVTAKSDSNKVAVHFSIMLMLSEIIK